MERRARWRPSNLKAPAAAPPMRVTNALGTDGGAACLYLYGPIDEMGAEWGGISAAEFVDALNAVQASRVELRVASPGGDFWEATVMRAALVRHPATVTAHIDGLAASAASVLITGADKVIMERGSQQMIHRASTLAIGNAEDLRADADLLEKVDRDIAGFYLERSGQGTVESWLAAMSAETWFTADEAVAAGLADEIAPDPTRTRDAAQESEQESEPVAASADHWILAAWRYAGRDGAPAPVLPTAVRAEVDVESPATPGDPPVSAAADPAPDDDPDDDLDPEVADTAQLDDEAITRIAERVAEHLAPLLTPAAAASPPIPLAIDVEADTALAALFARTVRAGGIPTYPAAPTAAAQPPAACPAAGSTPELPPAFDPELIRSAVRKANQR